LPGPRWVLDTESVLRFGSRRSLMSAAVKRSHFKLTFIVLAMGSTAFSLLQSLVSPVL